MLPFFFLTCTLYVSIVHLLISVLVLIVIISIVNSVYLDFYIFHPVTITCYKMLPKIKFYIFVIAVD